MDRYEFYSNLQSYQKNSLEHYGILGQKWGKRRWQNSDGTFNAEGKERYFGKKSNDEKIGGLMSSMLKRASKMADKITEKQVNKWNNNDDYRNKMINKNADIMKKHRSLYGMDGLNDDEIDKLTKAIIKKGVADIYEVRKEAAKYKADKKNYFNDIDIDDMQIHDWVKSSEVVEDHPMFKGKIGSNKKFDFKKLDESNQDENKSDEQYWKDKAEAEKYLDENYDRDFAEVIKDDYGTGGEWGDVDAAYEQYKQDPLTYLRKNSRDHKYSDITDHDMRKAEKEAEKLEKKLSKADWAERREILQKLADDPKFKSMYNEINEKYDKQNEEALSRMEEIFDDYDDQETEHLATAGIMGMLHNGYYPNPTMSDLADCAWFYAYEDGNQGDNTAEYLYATIDKGISDNELNKLYDQIHVRKDAKEEAKINLKKDPVLSNLNDRYLDMIVDRKMDDDRYADNDGYWKLYAATEGSSKLNEKTKKDYAEAKNISKKLSKSCGNTDGWDYLNQAIENLGLSDTELSNMSQSDWDKVNAEVNRLKK